MIHADFGPRNFHYHPETGLTTFDFGNCCYHWFSADLAISLSILRHYPDRNQYRTWLLSGYQDISPLDPNFLAHLSWFIRLRILYVYLDRLAYFGPTPTAPQQQILQQLQQQVHKQFQWE
jgi:Ser/Thr protein kinase RdoA (MazF antagonist)